MADPELIMMTRGKWPDMPIHLSVKFWQSMGVERIVLLRELSLDEIEK